jgi:hypothetical protein
MTKKYTLTTSEETVTENPEDIIRLMKLAGLTNAQPVAEEEVTEEIEAEVYEPTEANDNLDLDDYSKKSPESIAKQKKSIQPTLGDNPLEYSLDENEIQEALMKEFDESEKLAEERVDEIPLLAPVVGAIARGALALGKAAIANPVKTAVAHSVLTGGGDEPVNASKKKKGSKLNASCGAQHEVKEEEVEEGVSLSGATPNTGNPHKDQTTTYIPTKLHASKKKKGEKLNAVKEETEEVTEAQSPAQKAAFAKMLAAKNGKKDDTVEEKEETTVEENLEKAQEQINELKEDCSCGHGSDCDCGPECGCGCNAVNEDQLRLTKLINY